MKQFCISSFTMERSMTKMFRAVKTLLGTCFEVVNLDGLPTPEVGSLAAIWANNWVAMVQLLIAKIFKGRKWLHWMLAASFLLAYSGVVARQHCVGVCPGGRLVSRILSGEAGSCSLAQRRMFSSPVQSMRQKRCCCLPLPSRLTWWVTVKSLLRSRPKIIVLPSRCWAPRGWWGGELLFTFLRGL